MNPAEIIAEAIRLFRQYERDARSNAFRTHKGSDVWKLHDAQRQEAKDIADRLEAIRLNKPGSGWIVGSGGKIPLWRSWDHVGNPCWVPDKADATRYARRQDAELVHREDEDAWAVVWYEPEAEK